MSETAEFLISLGGVLLLGLATDTIGRYTPLPRVTLLLLFGFLIGPGFGDLLPQNFIDLFEITADMALVMVGFLLGSQFTVKAVRRHGREILGISLEAVS